MMNHLTLLLTSLAAFAPAALALPEDGSSRDQKGYTAETRTLDQIYEAAKREGGVINVWHGGDELSFQQAAIKEAFEAKFPELKLNMTVDLSKYLDGEIDDQIATDSVYVDSIILQTLQDYPRWEREGALLNYAPLGFDQVYPQFKAPSAAYYGVEIFTWMNIWNNAKLPNANFSTFEEFTKPEYKGKLVLTYPTDDDAVLFAFNLIVKSLGRDWLDRLMKNKPRWVRGTGTPLTLLRESNDSVAVSFTTNGGLKPIAGTNFTFPVDAEFVSWAQTAAILKKAPHPEGAKLLHSWMLTPDFQKSIGWSVRKDVSPPAGYPDIINMRNTDPTAFKKWMVDRAAVERLRFWYESLLGPPQGVSPLYDGI